MHETLTQEIKCNTPVLCMTNFIKSRNVYVGCLDGCIKFLDNENGRLVNEKFTSSQENNSGINNINSIDNLVVSTTFNRQFRVDDPRNPSNPINVKHMKNKPLKMETSSQYAILALADRRIEVYDKRDWNNPVEIRESPFDLQVNCLKTFPDEEGFAIASIDGRVAMEYFSTIANAETKRFAFRCHRQTDALTNTQIAYPINGLGFDDNILYTAGSDGIINVWDWHSRKKNVSFNQLKYDNNQIQSIVKLDINDTNDFLALGTSDDGFKTKDLNYYSKVPEYASNIYISKLS